MPAPTTTAIWRRPSGNDGFRGHIRLLCGPLLRIDWIAESRHKAGTQALLTASRKKLSLVDCVSFQTMRELSVRTAFCFDNHFREQGFKVLPYVSM